MSRIILLIPILLTYANEMLGQENLVPNPSFEDVLDCPHLFIGAGSLIWANPWINALQTPDLYNACSPIGAGVPLSNTNCYQPADRKSVV